MYFNKLASMNIFTEDTLSSRVELIEVFLSFEFENVEECLALTLKSSDVKNGSFVPVILDCLLCFIRRF